MDATKQHLQIQTPAQLQTVSDDFQKLIAMPHRVDMATLIEKANDPLKFIQTTGEWVAKSGMFGTLPRIELGNVIVIACMELGLGLVEFQQTFDVLPTGKLRKKAMAAHAEFMAEGGTVTWIEVGTSGKQYAEAQFSYKGQTMTFEFTMDDARAAGLVRKDSAWEKWMPDMLCARVLSRGIARLCPKIYAGYMEDEIAPVVPELNLQTPILKSSSPVAQKVVETQAKDTGLKAEPEKPVSSSAESGFDDAPADGPKLLPESVANEICLALGTAAKTDSAIKFCLKNGWITEEQSKSGEPFRYLTEEQAATVLRKAKNSQPAKI